MKRLVWLVFLVAGLVVLFWGCYMLKKSQEALGWPKTKGNVISSLLYIKHLPKLIDPGVDPARWYGASVQYEYLIGDKTYLSNRVSFGEYDSRNPRNAFNVINKFRPHHGVIVYYDPKNPQEAVLEPGKIGSIFMPLMAVGGLCAFFGLFFFYGKSLEINPYPTAAYMHRGYIYQNEGNLDQALLEYNKAIEINPNFAMSYINRGSIYYQKGNLDQATADFNKAIEINPHDALAYVARAKAYLSQQQYDKAWTDVHKAMAMGFNVSPATLENLKKASGREN